MTASQYMTADEVLLSLQTAQLELRYQHALQQAERIYEEERARTLRVQLLLLEDDNDRLRDQMHDDQDEMQKLEGTNEELYEQLATAEADFRAAQIELKAHSRDLERYKAEIDALNMASSDSAKLLSEKLILSREVATLKPELEHLRSQASTQQNLLAEKLSLERDMNTLQVELETERRAIQRMKAQDKTAGHGESVMLNEIEQLKKDLGKEKRNTQKLERENMKKAADWDGQKETLEGKLDAFRNKLRTTKEQLTEAQEELERIQALKFAQAAEATKARMNGTTNSRKRNVARFDPDATIGTPGHGGMAKKQKISILPGDKSAFSITPFLNRTASILPESPSIETQEIGAEEPIIKAATKSGSQGPIEVEEDAPKPVVKKPAGRKPAAAKSKGDEALRESTNAKANRVVKKPALAKVMEELEKEAESEQPVVSENTLEPSADEPKKTKLFANRPTIFDDDGDGPRRTIKKLNLTGLRGGGNGNPLNKLNLGAKNKVLSEFSPLKKDRRVMV